MECPAGQTSLRLDVPDLGIVHIGSYCQRTTGTYRAVTEKVQIIISLSYHESSIVGEMHHRFLNYSHSIIIYHIYGNTKFQCHLSSSFNSSGSLVETHVWIHAS